MLYIKYTLVQTTENSSFISRMIWGYCSILSSIQVIPEWWIGLPVWASPNSQWLWEQRFLQVWRANYCVVVNLWDTVVHGNQLQKGCTERLLQFLECRKAIVEFIWNVRWLGKGCCECRKVSIKVDQVLICQQIDLEWGFCDNWMANNFIQYHYQKWYLTLWLKIESAPI